MVVRRKKRSSSHKRSTKSTSQTKAKTKSKSKKAKTKTKAKAKTKKTRIERPRWVVRPDAEGEFRVVWGSIHKYRFGNHVGSGAYGDVFVGRHKKSGIPVAIKEMKEDEKERERTAKEVNTLLRVHDGPNIIRLYDLVRDDNLVSHLVFEYVEESRWKALYRRMGEEDVPYYMYKILLGLAYAHKENVLHRDIKPGNILIDHKRRKVRIIDWGCAGLWELGKSFTRFPGTRPYKASEMLLHIHQYGHGVDVWSAGVVFASMLFGKVPFFPAMQSDEEQLVLHTRMFGTSKLKAYTQRVGVPLPGSIKRTAHKVKSLRSLVTEENHTKVSSASLNLLRQMLAFDPVKRITAADALDHPYFDNVRNDAEDITLSSDSDSDSGGVRFHAVRDQDVEFGIGWEESGPSSWIGYSSSDEDGSSSGFFGLGLVHRDDARKWSESS